MDGCKTLTDREQLSFDGLLYNDINLHNKAVQI